MLCRVKAGYRLSEEWTNVKRVIVHHMMIKLAWSAHCTEVEVLCLLRAIAHVHRSLVSFGFEVSSLELGCWQSGPKELRVALDLKATVEVRGTLMNLLLVKGFKAWFILRSIHPVMARELGWKGKVSLSRGSMESLILILLILLVLDLIEIVCDIVKNEPLSIQYVLLLNRNLIEALA